MARGGPFNTLALKYTTSEMLELVVWAHYATLVSAQSAAASVEAAAVEAVQAMVGASAPPRAGRTCEW